MTVKKYLTLYLYDTFFLANSYERLFGMAESRPVRPVQLTLFNKEEHRKQWSAKQKRPLGQQLPGKRTNITLELIFYKLKDKILTIIGRIDTFTFPSAVN